MGDEGEGDVGMKCGEVRSPKSADSKEAGWVGRADPESERGESRRGVEVKMGEWGGESSPQSAIPWEVGWDSDADPRKEVVNDGREDRVGEGGGGGREGGGECCGVGCEGGSSDACDRRPDCSIKAISALRFLREPKRDRAEST